MWAPLLIYVAKHMCKRGNLHTRKPSMREEPFSPTPSLYQSHNMSPLDIELMASNLEKNKVENDQVNMSPKATRTNEKD